MLIVVFIGTTLAVCYICLKNRGRICGRKKDSTNLKKAGPSSPANNEEIDIAAVNAI